MSGDASAENNQEITRQDTLLLRNVVVAVPVTSRTHSNRPSNSPSHVVTHVVAGATIKSNTQTADTDPGGSLDPALWTCTLRDGFESQPVSSSGSESEDGSLSPPGSTKDSRLLQTFVARTSDALLSTSPGIQLDDLNSDSSLNSGFPTIVMSPATENATGGAEKVAAKRSGRLDIWQSCMNVLKTFVPDTWQKQRPTAAMQGSKADLESESLARDIALGWGLGGEGRGWMSRDGSSEAVHTNATWQAEGEPHGSNLTPRSPDVSSPNHDTPVNYFGHQTASECDVAMAGSRCKPIDIAPSIPIEEEEMEEERSPVGGLDSRKWDTWRGNGEAWSIGDEGEEEHMRISDAGRTKLRIIADIGEEERSEEDDPEEEEEGKWKGRPCNRVEETGRASEHELRKKEQTAALIKAFLVARRVHVDDKAVEVMQGVFLGSIGVALNREELEGLGVTCILTVATNILPKFPNHFRYTIVDVLDHPDVDLRSRFAECFAVIDEARRRGTGILVHCFAGRSRSVTVVVAYMMKYLGLSFDRALEKVQKLRPVANPNEGFKRQLREFERTTEQERRGKRLL